MGGRHGSYVSAVKPDEEKGTGSKNRQALAIYSRGRTDRVLLLEGSHPTEANHCRFSSRSSEQDNIVSRRLTANSLNHNMLVLSQL